MNLSWHLNFYHRIKLLGVFLFSGARPFHCSLCSASFTQQGTLKEHLISHTGQRKHKCETCGKCYLRKRYLMIHQRTHLDIMPYECTQCLKRFARRDGLTRHLQTHAGTKPYSCSQCEKRFTRRYKMSEHMRIAHDIIVPIIRTQIALPLEKPPTVENIEEKKVLTREQLPANPLPRETYVRGITLNTKPGDQNASTSAGAGIVQNLEEWLGMEISRLKKENGETENSKAKEIEKNYEMNNKNDEMCNKNSDKVSSEEKSSDDESSKKESSRKEDNSTENLPNDTLTETTIQIVQRKSITSVTTVPTTNSINTSSNQQPEHAVQQFSMTQKPFITQSFVNENTTLSNQSSNDNFISETSTSGLNCQASNDGSDGYNPQPQTVEPRGVKEELQEKINEQLMHEQLMREIQKILFNRSNSQPVSTENKNNKQIQDMGVINVCENSQNINSQPNLKASNVLGGFSTTQDVNIPPVNIQNGFQQLESSNQQATNTTLNMIVSNQQQHHNVRKIVKPNILSSTASKGNNIAHVLQNNNNVAVQQKQFVNKSAVQQNPSQQTLVQFTPDVVSQTIQMNDKLFVLGNQDIVHKTVAQPILAQSSLGQPIQHPNVQNVATVMQINQAQLAHLTEDQVKRLRSNQSVVVRQQVTLPSTQRPTLISASENVSVTDQVQSQSTGPTSAYLSSSQIQSLFNQIQQP